MKSLKASAFRLGAWLLLGLCGSAAGQIAQGTAFTYQGVLRETGLPASGEYDLRFRLFNAASGGAQVGSTICRDNVSVTSGLFDVSLDFGSSAFTGSARWLEVSVRAGGPTGNCGTGPYTTLSGRTALGPAPGAIFSNLAGGAVGTFTILEGSPARVSFGTSGLCTLGIDSAGPAGVLLRDPIGLRVLPPTPTPTPSRILFGPTDDCSIGISPQLRGLILLDPNGGRFINPFPGLPTRAFFGPTDDCSIGIDPQLRGLILRDPTGPRLINPQPNLPTSILFGPTDDCRIGIDPTLSGLILYDPRGVRICVPNVPSLPPTRILFGPTDDCTIGIDPLRSGLILRDPRGVRIDPPGPVDLPTLLFGPTDLCTVGINPQVPGLILTDPHGVRLLNPFPTQPPRLLFGPTDQCGIGLSFFDVFTTLELSDPTGVRIRNPEPGRPSTLFIGETLECNISVLPAQSGRPGMAFTDPRGFQFNGGFVTMGIPTQAEFRLQLPTTNNPSGQALANRWIDASSRRWKENIRPIDDAEDKLALLRGVYFDWTIDHGGNPGMGFIAEEVGEVFPEVVAWEANGKDASGVSYDHLVAVTVEAIKSQRTKISELQSQNADLKARLERLEKLLQVAP
ncbi:MAG: tail fiber domain-containing protein [Phycisphaerae bacterium]|nr:tail fiber domain-containing protein [Phycisphaerae bacterium]